MVSDNEESSKDKLEIRFFGQLKTLAEKKGWTFPCYFELKNECSATELAEQMGIPTEEIEGVFINGVAKSLDKARISPGDRVGFIPYGIPGPYRVMLGFYKQKAKK